MKSIKEKSLELYPELRTDSDDWDVIEEQCDRDDQRKAFVLGANYVLEIIEQALTPQKCLTEAGIKVCPEALIKTALQTIEQLKEK